MLNKEELNYLAMLVVLDQRAVFKEFKNNNQLEEANKQKDVREEIIKSKTKDGEGLIGAIGRITNIDKSKEYDYIVVLTNGVSHYFWEEELEKLN